jgi:hypothetical protein
VLAVEDPHQASVIAQVILQDSLNSPLEAGGDTNRLIAGHMEGIIELDHPREGLLETADHLKASSRERN